MKKPIYRKVIRGNYSDQDIVAENVDVLIDQGGEVLIGSTCRLLPYFLLYNNTVYRTCVEHIANSNNITLNIIRADNRVENTPCNFWIEYTKVNE